MKELILVYLGVLIGLSLIVRRLSETGFRRGFIFFHGLGLTLFTVYFASKFPLFIEEEAATLNWIKSVDPRDSKQVKAAYMKDNHFVLIDTSHDLQILSLSSELADSSHSSKVMGTDREKLTRFLNRFIADSALLGNTDMIVCDVLFDLASNRRIDSALISVMHELFLKGKLVGVNSEVVQGISSQFVNPAHAGSVDIKLHAGVFFSHQLVSASGEKTLPYKMFLDLYKQKVEYLDVLGLSSYFLTQTPVTQRQTAFADTVFYGQNIFIPDLELGGQDLQPAAKNELMLSQYTAGDTWLHRFFQLFAVRDTQQPGFYANSSLLTYYKLGYMASDPAEPILASLLEKDNNKKNIVFIGVFNDPQVDVHQTAYGPMHGSLVMLNIYLNLVNRAHVLSLGYLGFLLVAFCMITKQIVEKRIANKKDQQGAVANNIFLFVHTVVVLLSEKLVAAIRKLSKLYNQNIYNSRRRFGSFSAGAPSNPKILSFRHRRSLVTLNQAMRNVAIILQNGIRMLFRRCKVAFQFIFVDQKHYWLLFATLYASIYFFNHVINVMGITIYIAAVDFSFRILTIDSHANDRL